MIGDRWDWWRLLFVPTVPARSKILALDIPTVVTGPRGCGKTMLLRRLSERLVVECEDVSQFAHLTSLSPFTSMPTILLMLLLIFLISQPQKIAHNLIASKPLYSRRLTFRPVRTGRTNE